MLPVKVRQDITVRYPKASAWHVGFDDAGWVCRVGAFRMRYVHELSHRYSGFPTVRWTVWWPSADYFQCIQHWGSHVAQFVKRHVDVVEGEIRHDRAIDEEFTRAYPALAEYLTMDWLEGAVRETSTLGISVDSGQWKARLADRDSGLVTFVSGDGFYAVLDALERHLAGGTADWRKDQFAKPRKGRK